MSPTFSIRPITPADDLAVARIIRGVMPEFGADGPGFAIHDPEVGAMCAAYDRPGAAYFVVERGGGVMGGGGVAPLDGGPAGVCELRKMYFLPALRGLGAGAALMQRCLAEARALGFRQVYLETLRGMDLIYEGVLEPPKGKEPDDWEPRVQTLFRSTAHGDDVDRPVKKSDGSWTYFAPDIAYHYNKVRRGFDALIDIFGADHGGYVKRMKAAVSALSDGKVPLDIKLIQLVKLYKNGEPFKMSKRAGTFVTLRDVVEEAGADVTRFIMLTRKNDVALDFDFAKVLEQSKDNPVFYVQYANARINSVMRKAREAGIVCDDTTLATLDLSGMTHEAEIALAKKIAEWPRLIEIAARGNEPHRVAFYLYELASELHGLWNRGNDDPSLRFFQTGNAATSAAKIALARAAGVVIGCGLGILGVTPVEEMR